MSTILDELESSAISTALSKDKTIFSFYESIDYYVKPVDLTKAGLAMLIDELQAIHDTMIETEDI